MLNIVQAAGWPIWLLITCSIIALAIIGERLWTLRPILVAPRELLQNVVDEYRQQGVNNDMLLKIATTSPLGRIFAAGLYNVRSSREIMKEAIEELLQLAVQGINKL